MLTHGESSIPARVDRQRGQLRDLTDDSLGASEPGLRLHTYGESSFPAKIGESPVLYYVEQQVAGGDIRGCIQGEGHSLHTLIFMVILHVPTPGSSHYLHSTVSYRY